MLRTFSFRTLLFIAHFGVIKSNAQYNNNLQLHAHFRDYLHTKEIYFEISQIQEVRFY